MAPRSCACEIVRAPLGGRRLQRAMAEGKARRGKRVTKGALALLLTLVAAFPSWAQSPDFDLDGLTQYKAEQPVSGTIRNFGFGLGGVLALWEEGFRKLHPGIRFEDHLPTSDAAIPALVTGVTDLAPDGGEATLTETLSFFEVHGYAPTAITVATGAFDIAGRSNG